MPLRFRIRPPGTRGERAVEVPPDGGELTLGRHAGVEVELPFPSVSGRHVRISRRGGGWTATDLGSVNGTWLGGRRMPPRQAMRLSPGDELRLADVTVIFDGDGAAAAGVAESTATLARRLVSDLFGAAAEQQVARVVVETGPARGESLALAVPGQRYRVGRAAHCELVIPDDDISREHAVFERRYDGVLVRDLGSKNGVRVDGVRITDGQRLHDGARVALGVTELSIEDPEDRYLTRMRSSEEASPAASPGPPPAPSARRSPTPLLVSAVAIAVLAGALTVGAWLLLGLG